MSAADKGQIKKLDPLGNDQAAIAEEEEEEELALSTAKDQHIVSQESEPTGMDLHSQKALILLVTGQTAIRRSMMTVALSAHFV